MADERYLTLYIPVQQAIVSYWIGELPPPQSAILLYVNERTLRYGKLSERINKTHFLISVKDGQGRLLHNGIKITRSSLWTHIAGLEGKGLLDIQHHKREQRGNVYEINIQNILAPVTKGILQTSAKSRSRGNRRRRIKAASSPK
jgi:hypothetical protein